MENYTTILTIGTNSQNSSPSYLSHTLTSPTWTSTTRRTGPYGYVRLQRVKPRSDVRMERRPILYDLQVRSTWYTTPFDYFHVIPLRLCR